LGVMAADTPALDDYWRLRVEEAKRRHLDNPTAESGAEYRRLLRLFSDLVLRDQPPPEE
jgi:hypothetical protein